ncbi:hypothetical protein LCGC14_2263210 [marine sediment metagenome]|uniref:Prokaryotic-type class I peptide chain release factors domain-containing protein n=1 Tax=marine sediment metagenome TaxID=412755 RepID=A0A0F9FU18_9ZZZZ
MNRIKKENLMELQLLFSVTKKDFVITWFSGKGAGGQHRNKHQNCCRLKHPESGVHTIGQNSRSRKQNLEDAFLKLTKHPVFKNWINMITHRIMLKKDNSEELQQIVNEAMKSENLKIEYYQGK